MIRTAKAEVLKLVHPQQSPRSSLALLGEDDPDAEPLKVALKHARMHARVRLVWERLDLCFL